MLSARGSVGLSLSEAPCGEEKLSAAALARPPPNSLMANEKKCSADLQREKSCLLTSEVQAHLLKPDFQMHNFLWQMLLTFTQNLPAQGGAQHSEVAWTPVQ